jgi:uncharacterized protein (TIRG00374 family)
MHRLGRRDTLWPALGEGVFMKQHWGFIVRLLVAIAGVAFIVLSLTWQDQVSLPAGYRLPSGITLDEAQAFPIVKAGDDALTLNVSRLAGTSADAQERIARSALGQSADEPRLQPGVLTTIAQLCWPPVVWGLLCLAGVFPVQAWRWLILMRCRGMEVAFGRAFRLTMAGLFFNFCMPGTTGGDVVKAYYTAKNSGQRSTAVMSVLFDRLVGLLALVLLAALVGLTMLDQPFVARITFSLWVGLLLLTLALVAYQSSWLRQALKLDRLLSWLPGGDLVAKVDQAAVAYRDHKAVVAQAVGISLAVHLCLMSAAAFAGRAMGVEHHFGLLLAVLPLVVLAGSLPITPQGIGVMEWLALTLLLEPPLATANELVGMLLLFRLCMLAFALLGSLVLLRGDIHLFPEKQEPDASEPSTSTAQQKVVSNA